VLLSCPSNHRGDRPVRRSRHGQRAQDNVVERLFPIAADKTEVESRRELQSDDDEFTMKRLWRPQTRNSSLLSTPGCAMDQMGRIGGGDMRGIGVFALGSLDERRS
jgi:hypothetical protein